MNSNKLLTRINSYIYLDTKPRTPLQDAPTREQCFGFEFMSMVQFCNVAVVHGVGRSRACNAFGGDRGKYQVISDRMARAYNGRKFVLIRAVDEYFKQLGIDW